MNGQYTTILIAATRGLVFRTTRPLIKEIIHYDIQLKLLDVLNTSKSCCKRSLKRVYQVQLLVHLILYETCIDTDMIAEKRSAAALSFSLYISLSFRKSVDSIAIYYIVDIFDIYSNRVYRLYYYDRISQIFYLYLRFISLREMNLYRSIALLYSIFLQVYRPIRIVLDSYSYLIQYDCIQHCYMQSKYRYRYGTYLYHRFMNL